MIYTAVTAADEIARSGALFIKAAALDEIGVYVRQKAHAAHEAFSIAPRSPG